MKKFFAIAFIASTLVACNNSGEKKASDAVDAVKEEAGKVVDAAKDTIGKVVDAAVDTITK